MMTLIRINSTSPFSAVVKIMNKRSFQRIWQIKQQPLKNSLTMTNQCLQFAVVINCLVNITLAQTVKRFRASVHYHTGLKAKTSPSSSAISESKMKEPDKYTTALKITSG